jgi:hypothetical protein
MRRDPESGVRRKDACMGQKRVSGLPDTVTLLPQEISREEYYGLIAEILPPM